MSAYADYNYAPSLKYVHFERIIPIKLLDKLPVLSHYII